MSQERISVVDLRPDDTVIVHFDGFLSKVQRVELTARIKESFPHNDVKLMEGGMTITVARPGANELMERIALATEQLAKQFDQVSGCGNALLVEKP